MRGGCVLLSVWSGLNLLVGLGVTGVLLSGRNAPALAYAFTDAEIAALDPKVVAVVNGIAHLANPLIAAFCGLVLVLLWRAVVHGVRWAWWAIALTLTPVQLMGFVSDRFFANANLAANAISTAMLLAGLALSYAPDADGRRE